MTDISKCLLVNLYYGDIVNQFDKLLTEMRMSYIKESFHSSVFGQCYKFIVLEYKEQEKIVSYLLNKDEVMGKKIITLTDEQIELLICMFQK
jgi:hypothetical protein